MARMPYTYFLYRTVVLTSISHNVSASMWKCGLHDLNAKHAPCGWASFQLLHSCYVVHVQT